MSVIWCRYELIIVPSRANMYLPKGKTKKTEEQKK
nr:MAG TPA: hypothetical protein [Caudoviricetes sp.]